MDLQLESVNALGESGEAVAQGRLLPAKFGELGRHRGARGFGRGELDARLADRAVDRIEDGGQLCGHACGDLALRPADHGATSGLRRCVAFAFALPFELHDPRLARAHALLESLDVEPRAHLAVARRLELGEHPLARGRIEDRPRRLEGSGESIVRGSRGGLGLIDGRRHLGERGRKAIAVGDRGLVTHRGAVDLLGVRRQRGVVGAQRRKRRLGPLARRIEPVHRIGESFTQGVGDDDDLVAALGCGIPFCRQLEPRPPLPRPGAERVLGVHLARAGHDRDRAAELAPRPAPDRPPEPRRGRRRRRHAPGFRALHRAR